MVASQHPLRSCLTQSPGWLLRNILFALVVLKVDCSLWSHPLRSCLTQSPGWLLRNILFALVVLKVDCSLWSHPLRSCLTQSPLKTSAVLMFLLFCTYPQNQASLFRVYVQKSPHCSCGLCDPVRIQT